MPYIWEVYKKKSFTFRVTRCSAWRIDVVLKFWYKKIGNSLSWAYPPLYEIRKWLELCIVATSPVTVSWDEEWHSWYRTYFPLNDKEWYLEAYNDYWEVDNRRGTIDDYRKNRCKWCYVNKKDMIKKIYRGFLDFFSSDKYNPKEWEWDLDKFGDIVAKNFNMTFYGWQLNCHLREFDRKTAIKFVTEFLNENYHFPWSIDKDEEKRIKEKEMKRLIKNLFPEKLDPEKEWNDKYDWKYHYISELNTLKFSGWGWGFGDSAEDFFSLKIEKYLNWEEEKSDIKKFYFSPLWIYSCIDICLSVWVERPFHLEFWYYDKCYVDSFRNRMEKIIWLKKWEKAEFQSNWEPDNVNMVYEAIDNETWHLTIEEDANARNEEIEKEDYDRKPVTLKVDKKQMISTIYSGLIFLFYSWRITKKEMKERNAYNDELKVYWEWVDCPEIPYDFFSEKVEEYLRSNWILYREIFIKR